MAKKEDKKIVDLKFLNPETDEDREAAIHALEQLISSTGWALIKRVLTENVYIKSGEILNERYDKTPIYNEDDKLKDQRQFIIKLLNMPGDQLADLKGESIEEDEENFDPYFKREDFEKRK